MWFTGEAWCMADGYKWQAVWPEGMITDKLECPKCRRMVGLVSLDLVEPEVN